MAKKFGPPNEDSYFRRVEMVNAARAANARKLPSHAKVPRHRKPSGLQRLFRGKRGQ